MLRWWRTIGLPVALSAGLLAGLPDTPAAPNVSSAPIDASLPTQDEAPASAATRAATAARATDIVPGSVNRSSLNLRATYDVSVWLSYASRQLAVDSRMTIVNTSGDSIDRLELNAIAARLGGLRIRSAVVDGRAVSPKIAAQTMVVPL